MYSPASPQILWSRISKVIEVFLKHGQDLNVDIPYGPTEALGGISKNSCKALHIARAEASKTLLEQGAHVNALDSYGMTALDVVIQDGKVFFTEEILITGLILLEHGGCITLSTESLLPSFLDTSLRYRIYVPEALRNPPRLQRQMTLAQRLRSLVPSLLGGK